MNEQDGFTLIELMVVVAIVSVLAAIAIPAYMNYTTKAKFTEVVLATAPIKTAVSTCAISGDCISGGDVISIPASIVGDSASFVPTQANSSVQAVQAFMNATSAGMFNSSNSAAFAPVYFKGGSYVQPSPFYPGYYCLGTSPADAACGAGAGLTQQLGYGRIVPASSFNSAYTALTGNGSSGSSSGGALAMPCVGAGDSCSPPTKYVASASSDTTGTITATAVSSSGLNGETYILIPSYSSGRVDWLASGSCLTRSGGALC